MRSLTRRVAELPTWARVAIVAALYFVAGRLALLMAIPPGYATAVWPAAGVAVVGLLVSGRGAWPGVLLGSIAVNIGTSFDPTTSATITRSLLLAAAIGLGAAAQALAAVSLVRRFVGYPNGAQSVRDVLRLLLLAGPVACLIGSSWGVSTLALAGIVPWSNAVFSWLTWWAGDTIGALLFVPLLLTFVGEPYEQWRRRRLTVALPLAIGFTVVTLLFLRASAWENERLDNELTRRAESVAQALERRMEQYIEVVAALASVYDADPELSRDAFSAVVERPLSRHPGVRALAWAPRVTQDQRAHVEAHASFEIRERDAGRVVRAATRPEYFPVARIEPYRSENAAIGFDLASEVVRRTTIEQATASGAPTMTTPINLVQDQVGERGFLILVPVYRRGAVHDTPDQRRGALVGCASGVFRARATLFHALRASDRGDLNVRVTDEALSGAPGAIYEDNVGPAAARTPWTTSIDVAGRKWRIELTPTVDLAARQKSWQAWMVLAGGLLFVGTLGGFLLLVTGREARIAEVLTEIQSLNVALEDRVRARTSELSAMVKERDVLLQEVHHRVKNNLQVIASLINMQLRQLEAGPSRAALQECKTRVQTIALIHEKLYQSQNYARVPFSEYARSLATNVFRAAGVSTNDVELDLAIEDMSLAVDKAIPCGLLLNELITNSLKHAFPNGRRGTVHVELTKLAARQMRLTVRDDGIGLPKGFAPERSESLGLQLVTTLAEQLDAKLLMADGPGASFQLTFEDDAA